MNTKDSSSSNNKPSSSSSQLEISSADIIRLIQHHLTEAGLHTSCRVLQQESGIKSGGISSVSSMTLRGWCKDGRWGDVLDCLGSIDFGRGEVVIGGDGGRKSLILAELMAEVHEMSILELADAGEVELARAAIRLLSNSITEENDDSDDENNHEHSEMKERLRLLQHKVTEISALRTTASTTSSTTGNNDVLLLPSNYYGEDNISKQKKRDAIGKKLCDLVPIVPSDRLVSLLQQAVKWQCHTGVLPTVKQYWHDDDEDDDDDNMSESSGSDDENNEKKKKKRKKHKKKKHKKKKKMKKFDLLLGEVDVTPTYTDDFDPNESSSIVKDNKSSSSSTLTSYEQLQIQHAEKIITKPYSSLRLNKKCYIESCLFFTLSNHYNSTETSLVTGSSDGCIEIWSSTSKYTQLRTADLPYQAKDAIMMHYEDTTNEDEDEDTANNVVDDAVLTMCVNHENNMLCTGSANGTLYIWNISNGKCLRQMKKVHDGAVLSCCFSFDSSKILSGGADGNCREFGLRTSKMLKEFRGHGSFVNCCEYVLVGERRVDSSDGGGDSIVSGELVVLTGSGDGTVRIWDGRSSEMRRIIRPASFSPYMESGAVSAGTVGETGLDGPAVIAVFPLHSRGRGNETMIVVTRSPCAYLVAYDGSMIRKYQRDDGKGIVSDKLSKEKSVPTSSSLSRGVEKGGGDFVAATISATNTWLYVATEDGKCFCFNVYTGKVERVLQSFAEEGSTAAGEGGSRVAEITGLVHHPQKGMVVSYSNEKSQKRGVLTVWK